MAKGKKNRPAVTSDSFNSAPAPDSTHQIDDTAKNSVLEDSSASVSGASKVAAESGEAPVEQIDDTAKLEAVTEIPQDPAEDLKSKSKEEKVLEQPKEEVEVPAEEPKLELDEVPIQDAPKLRVLIVGGGLVGALAAIKFQQRGCRVKLVEQRSDLRSPDVNGRGRSINLALSERGIQPLKSCEVFDAVKSSLVPMSGRTLHRLNGSTEFVPYGKQGQSINSIDRLMLNRVLLDHAEKAGVELQFNASIRECRLDENYCTIVDKGAQSSETEEKFDLLIGADGAYSSVRKEIMKKTRMDFEQVYIPHGYLELSITAFEIDSKPKMHANSLHIWPRHEFMMIALPNTDNSFTLTLFMPYARFDRIKTREEVLQFFHEEFPDSVPLIGEELLTELWFSNPIGSLVSIKCSPYNHKNAVIIGDACHAMVPFYGQGMNCGFEDVLVLDSALFGQHEWLPIDSQPQISQSMSLEDKLHEYSEFRQDDAKAICDLAMYNYFEMRSNVLSWGFRIRKKVEGVLNWIAPTRVIPLYTMVSFSQLRYSHVVQRWNRQSYWLTVGPSILAGVAAAGLIIARKTLRN